MTGIKKSGDGLPKFVKIKDGKRFGDKVQAFKLKNVIKPSLNFILFVQ